jgi:Transposase domain (DUF772)
VPAEVVATVMVLQALEGRSDREAISALRRDIAWKVACGLRLDDEGFHPTVLVQTERTLLRRALRRLCYWSLQPIDAATDAVGLPLVPNHRGSFWHRRRHKCQQRTNPQDDKFGQQYNRRHETFNDGDVCQENHQSGRGSGDLFHSPTS